MSIKTDIIYFNDSHLNYIGFPSSSTFTISVQSCCSVLADRTHFNTNVTYLDTNELYIRSYNPYESAVIIGAGSNLKDAKGTVLIKNGIWQSTLDTVVIGENPDSQANLVSIEMDGSHFKDMNLGSISLLARDSGALPTTSAVWLSIWKQVSGDNYSLLAVSTEAKAQVLGQWTKWEFNNVELTGARIRIAALDTPSTPFASASQLGCKVQERGVDDSCLIHGKSQPMQYHPAMIVRAIALGGVKIQEIESEDQIPQNPDPNTLYCIPEK